MNGAQILKLQSRDLLLESSPIQSVNDGIVIPLETVGSAQAAPYAPSQSASESTAPLPQVEGPTAECTVAKHSGLPHLLSQYKRRRIIDTHNVQQKEKVPNTRSSGLELGKPELPDLASPVTPNMECDPEGVAHTERRGDLEVLPVQIDAQQPFSLNGCEQPVGDNSHLLHHTDPGAALSKTEPRESLQKLVRQLKQKVRQQRDQLSQAAQFNKRRKAIQDQLDKQKNGRIASLELDLAVYRREF